MGIQRIIESLNQEINLLQQARAILTGESTKAGKRNLSPEARQRIADAQKRRWAKHRKTVKK